MANICILGAGAFGTALALYTHRLGHAVRVWAFDKGLPEMITETRENKMYLPGFELPGPVEFTADHARALSGADLVLLVVPSAHMRGVAKRIHGAVPEKALIVSTAKGIENQSLSLMNEVLEQELPECAPRLTYLSGPSFAKEIARGLPADVALASRDIGVARKAQMILHSPLLRVYTSNDVIGIELGGALKNVIAVACGAADGLGFGESGRASLVTRGLAEIARLGVAMGANPLTFLGLAGVGDLFLTCTSELSRNRTLGMRLAAGEKPDEIVSSQKAVAESYYSSRPVYEMSRRMNVEMPISEEVYRVLHEGEDLATAAFRLVNREAKEELKGIFPVG